MRPFPPVPGLSRREFVRLATMAGLGSIAAPALARLAVAGAAPLFEEVPPSASGITWVHDNAISPDRYLPETMGPGVAFLDYDNDGWMDLFMVNSGPCDFFTPKTPLSNALYKNNRDGTFTDVTKTAGLTGGTFAMGMAVGDYDNDGYQDILVTNYGPPTLYHNNGNGTFTDVTAKSGLAAGPHWTTSAVWFDYDNDGKLDLFLCSFVDFSLKNNVFCGDNTLGRRFYCIPRVFKPTSSALYRNNGDGTFTLASGGTDIEAAKGKALGVVATDINNDGQMDLFVANDTVQNFLFANRGKGKWEEIGLAAEVAYSANGTPRSGMGVDSTDFDGDGKQDLFVANVDQEMFSLYKNDGNEYFSDVAAANGVAQATRLFSGWGLKFFDYDNDGLVDLFLANGHPDDMIDQYQPDGDVQGAAARLPQRRQQAPERQPRRRAGVHQGVPRAGPLHRRLQQRRPDRRVRGQQRRGAGPPQEQRRRGQPLGRPAAAGDDVQPRRHWRAHHVVGRGQGPDAPESRRRQLSVEPRSPRGARARHRHEGGLRGDRLAAAERPQGALHRRPRGSLRVDHGGEGEDRYVTSDACGNATPAPCYTPAYEHESTRSAGRGRSRSRRP